MGFFTSRKLDDDYVPDGKTTVVKTIRSRFYGKHSQKAREDPERTTTFASQDASTAHILSQPATTPHIRHTVSVPILGSKRKANRSPEINPRSLSRRLKSSVRKNLPGEDEEPTPPKPSEGKQPDGNPPQPTSSRKPTDSVTMTLAQRLNELAAANSQGLLSEDEYRVLRQNLFERFASNATVPTEKPVVPATSSVRQHHRGPSEGQASTSSRPSSNFIVDLPRSGSIRSPSVRSRSSVRSGVTSLFRRVTSGHRAGASKDFSDTSSVISGVSSYSTRPLALRKQSSNTSVHTDVSRHADTMSISSRMTGHGSERPHLNLDTSSPHTPVRPSNSSLRRLASPPSSFPRTPASEKSYGSLQSVFEDSHLKNSQDIRNEMASIEAERNSLLDAFNGLEITTLAKRQRTPNSRPATIVVESSEHRNSTITILPDASSFLRATRLKDSDALSINSGVSNRSLSRSIHSRNLSSSKPSTPLASSRGSLQSKNSISSVSSSRAAKGKHVPPVPALPSYMGNLGHGSTSSLNLARSTGHLPMGTLPEDELDVTMDLDEREEEAYLDMEMEDLRRRREEVSRRYEARLDYLRAKLKGAQLHEKLMKK